MLLCACTPLAWATADPSASGTRDATGEGTGAKAAAEPPECTVRLIDGRQVSGVLIEQNEQLIRVRVEGISTPFLREQVLSLTIHPPFKERYRTLSAAIDPNDVPQRLRLAQWLFQREEYDLALIEIDKALVAEPDHPSAARMRLIVAQQRLLAEAAKGDTADPEPSPMSEEGVGGEGVRADRPWIPRDFPRLSEDQVNLLKVYELDLSDPPPLRFPPQAIESLLEDYRGDPRVPTTREARAALLRQPPERLVELMFRLRAREHYNNVRVMGHPKPAQLFRDRVHRGWLQNACSTSRCHGGASAGRLWLGTHARNSDRTVYTNMLILDRYRLADGRPLIDYERPAQSPLLQAALRRDRSSFPHPEVVPRQGGPTWRPVFDSEDDRGFRDAVEWISSMYVPRPDYPIDYDPPVPEGLPPAMPDGAGDPQER